MTGSGGAGKTRLALHAAAAAVDAHADGTWWVELAPITSGAEVAERIVVAARLPLDPVTDPVAQLARHWQEDAAVLLVLDNAEHVVGAVADVVARLLAATPGVRVLVTSREPLGVPGEVVFRVPSLSAPAASPAGVVTVQSLDSYDSGVCSSSGRGSVCPTLSSTTWRRRTSRRSALVSMGSRWPSSWLRPAPFDVGRTDRDRLERRIPVAHRRCPHRLAAPTDAVGVDRVERGRSRRRRAGGVSPWAVFQAPFTLDAAEAVAADGDVVEAVMVLDLVARLVDKSLLLLDDDTGRYALLETVRQFGVDRLREADELLITRQRHARWFAEWSTQVGHGRHGVDNTCVLADMPDAVAALEWSYDSDVAAAARICAGLAWFRAALGSYTSLVRQCDWVGSSTAPEILATGPSPPRVPPSARSSPDGWSSSS